MANQQVDRMPVSLEMVSPGGPCLAYHIGCVVDDALFVHGGINKVGSTTPLSGFHRYDFGNGTWTEVKTPNSPALSHHASVVIGNRYIVLIGGWTGKFRVSDVVIYDTVSSVWSYPKTTGFPVGAGLSSHTATVLGNGGILIVGREGSLRMQRRTGSAFILKGDVTQGFFQYSEHVISVTSRTGHSLHVVGSKVVIIGGRDDKVLEVLPLEKQLASVPSVLLGALDNSLVSTLSPVAKEMSSRRHHVSVCCSKSIIVVHGGWTFDGRNRDPVSDMFLLELKPTIRWFLLGDTGISRAGHVCCSGSDRVFLHGGESSRGVITGSLFELKMTK